MSRRKKILFALVIQLGLLLVVELLLRIFLPAPPERVDGGIYRSGLFVRDEEVGWRARPNADVVHRLFENHAVRVRTNSRGYRDIEHGAKRADVARVIVLGDSFVFGFGVENDEIFTVHLRELLPGVEIVNLGVTAYNTVLEHRLLRIDGLAYQPDLVVLAFCQNDVWRGIPDVENRFAPRTKPGGVKAFLSEHWRLYAAVADVIARNKRLSRFFISIGIKEPLAGYEKLDPNVRPSLKQYPEALRALWTETMNELRALRETCREASVPLLVVSLPARQAVETEALASAIAYVDYDPEDFDPDKPARALDRFCREIGAAFVDPAGAFRAAGGGLYIPYDMHFSPKGHRVLAEALAPEIRRVLASR